MKYYKYELNIGIMNFISIIEAIIIYGTIIIFNGNYFNQMFGKENYIIFFLLLLSYFLLHELLHGIGYSFFAKDKKNIKYGIQLEKGVFYAMCQEEISKIGIIVSLLMPLIFLTIITLIIGLILNIPILVNLSIINYIGAIGDLALLSLVLKLPKEISYIDYNNDIGAYFLSNNDISNIKSIGIKCNETGKHSTKLIDKTHKLVVISKPSVFILLVLAIICLIPIFLN